jgi:hypothetical protein
MLAAPFALKQEVVFDNSTAQIQPCCQASILPLWSIAARTSITPEHGKPSHGRSRVLKAVGGL